MHAINNGIFSAKVETAMPIEAYVQYLSQPPGGPVRNY
jgi:hypothetical protein